MTDLTFSKPSCLLLVVLFFLAAAGLREGDRNPRARDASAHSRRPSGAEGDQGVEAGRRVHSELRGSAAVQGLARGVHRHPASGRAAHGLEGEACRI